jgi:hypothetical protein
MATSQPRRLSRQAYDKMTGAQKRMNSIRGILGGCGAKRLFCQANEEMKPEAQVASRG